MNELKTVHGPYQTNAEAMVDARPVYDAYRATYERGLMDRTNAVRLGEALASARVELGAYDERIVTWLARWEPEVVQVVIGWIERATQGEAGQAAPADDDRQDNADMVRASETVHYAGPGDGPLCSDSRDGDGWTEDSGAVTCVECSVALDLCGDGADDDQDDARGAGIDAAVESTGHMPGYYDNDLWPLLGEDDAQADEIAAEREFYRREEAAEAESERAEWREMAGNGSAS